MKDAAIRREIGILILRVCLGAMFVMHGYPIILGGPPAWERLGNVMTLVGIDVFPIAWGLLAGLFEVLGGMMFVFGFFTHYASFVLTLTMVMATVFHINKGDTFDSFSHPLELSIVTLSMLIIGAGRYSVDFWLFGKPEKFEQVDRSTDGFVLGSSL